MAIALAQTTPTAVTGDPAAIAFGSNVATGDLIVATGTYAHPGGANTPTCTDTRSSNYAANIVGPLSDASNSQDLVAWWALTPSGGADTVTLDYPTTGFTTGAVAAFSGVDQTTPVDVTPVTKAGAAASSSPSSGSITPVTNGCLVVSIIDSTDIRNMTSGPAGFTVIVDPASNDLYVAYLIQATAATINPTWTLVSGRYNSVTFAFRPASAGGKQLITARNPLRGLIAR